MSTHHSLFLESSVACGILHNVFFHEPSKVFLDQLFGQGVVQLWPSEFLEDADSDNHSVFAATEFEIDSLKRDYMRLFVGPIQKLAYPWGSYYTDKYQSLNGETTQQLRYFMKKYGIELQFEGNEMPDHIGIIFAILSELFKRNEEEAVQELIEEHLQPWFGQFSQNVQGHGQTGFYQHFARLAEGLLNYWRREFQGVTGRIEVATI